MSAASGAEETRTDVRDRGRPGSGKARPVASSVRHLASGEILFQKGDTRARLYRVQSGAICHYIQWPDGQTEVIEFAFPGDIVGLGNLDAHISTAQCMLATDVIPLSPSEADKALAGDAELSARLAAAGDREFEVLKQRALAGRSELPAQRVASLLLAVAGANGRERRDTLIIPDTMTSGAMAGALGLPLGDLATALRDLERRGLVSPADGGLRLDDIPGLEAFADGKQPQV